MIPISIFLALVSTMTLTGSSTGTAQTATDTIVCPADSIPVKMMVKAVSNNSFSPVFTLDEVTALPSPDVAAMTRHIDEGIDYSTGTGGLSIPLYSWSAGDLKMSLGLRYRLGAYKVKEGAGWLGLGWNLTGGGCVTREIIGLPDEKNNTSIRPVNQISTDENGHLYLQDIEEFKEDSDLDRYRYSCPGAEGSFVIKSGKIVQTPETDNIIEFTGTERDGVKDFLVTTPDGTKYYFTEREKLSFRIVPSMLTTPMFILNYQDAVSAWHLSKIESPGGADVALYSYTTLPGWQRGEVIGGESTTMTWSDSGLAGYPQIQSSNSTTPRNHTQTTFSGQKLLRGITTRTAIIDFTTKTDNAYYENDTPGMLTRIRVLNPNGECVREISLDMACYARSPRMLAGVEVRSAGVLVDSHEFSYIGDYTGGYDFFGYRNASSSWLRTIIDTQTGKMNPEIVSDPTRMKSRAMSCHKTGMGLTTHYEYEPSSVTQTGNGKTYTFPVGLRIKKITTSDPVTGRERVRDFTYSSPVCDVDFTELDAGCFTGLSGDYTYVLLQNTEIIERYYSTCLTFLTSSKLKGFQPENATVYYGVVEETESGTDMAVPVRTRYEYDVSRCKRPFVSANHTNVKATDIRTLTYCPFYENLPMPYVPPSFKDAVRTGARIRGSFMDGPCFEPRLIKKIEYEHSDMDYRPRLTEKVLLYHR